MNVKQMILSVVVKVLKSTISTAHLKRSDLEMEYLPGNKDRAPSFSIKPKDPQAFDYDLPQIINKLEDEGIVVDHAWSDEIQGHINRQ